MLIHNDKIEFKLSKAEKRKAKARARRLKMDLSKYMRHLVETDLDAEKTSKAA